MPKLIFHPDVNNEIKASYEWYQNQVEGLGDDFLAELESAYEAIEELPIIPGQTSVRTVADTCSVGSHSR